MRAASAFGRQRLDHAHRPRGDRVVLPELRQPGGHDRPARGDPRGHRAGRRHLAERAERHVRGRQDARELVVGDVAGEAHPVGHAQLRGIRLQLPAARLAPLDRRAREDRDHVRRQQLERLQRPAVALAPGHVALERDHVPAGQPQRGLGRLPVGERRPRLHEVGHDRDARQGHQARQAPPLLLAVDHQRPGADGQPPDAQRGRLQPAIARSRPARRRRGASPPPGGGRPGAPPPGAPVPSGGRPSRPASTGDGPRPRRAAGVPPGAAPRGPASRLPPSDSITATSERRATASATIRPYRRTPLSGAAQVQIPDRQPVAHRPPSR